MIEPILAALDADMTSDAAAHFTSLVVDYLASSRDTSAPVSTSLTSAQIAARFDEPLPIEGTSLAAIAKRLRDDVVADANHLYHPRAVGHQVSPPLPAAIWAEPSSPHSINRLRSQRCRRLRL